MSESEFILVPQLPSGLFFVFLCLAVIQSVGSHLRPSFLSLRSPSLKTNVVT